MTTNLLTGSTGLKTYPNTPQLAAAWLAVGPGLARDGLDQLRRKAAPIILCNASELLVPGPFTG